MAEIKSIARIKEKWTRVTPMRSDDYKLGIESPRRDWEKAAIAAAETFKTGVTTAAATGAYPKGVAKAGFSKWQGKARLKGPGRFSEGVMIGGDDFEKGFAPYRDEIEKVVMPTRFPKRDPRNYLRVQAIGTALAKKAAG